MVVSSIFLKKKPKKSEDFHSLNLEGFTYIVINWPDYTSPKHAIKHSVERFEKIFQKQKFPNVEKLVLNNFVYSSKLLNLLFGAFNGVKTLIVKSWNFNSEKLDISLTGLTLNHLEITLPTLMNFKLLPPTKLDTIIIKSLQPNSKTKTTRCQPKRQLIDASYSFSLKTVIIKKDPNDSNIIDFNPPLFVKKLFFFSNGGCFIFLNPLIYPDPIWTTHLTNVFVGGKQNALQFTQQEPDAKGERKPNEEMYPNCEKFGVYDEFGKTHTTWKKQ